MREFHEGRSSGVLLISPAVERGTVNYHLIIFVLTLNFPGECGVQPVLAGHDPAMGLNLICLSTAFPLDSTSGSRI